MPRPDEPLSTPATPASVRPSRGLLAGLLAFVLAFGAAGYAWLGNPQALAMAPGLAAAADAGDGKAPHALDKAQFEAMAQKLADRLKTQPDDAEGWAMLGRSYSVLGQPHKAAAAYRRVAELQPQSAQALADHADALGTAQGGTLVGEPAKLVARALQLDADNPKALALAGTLAFDRGEAALAAQHWAHAIQGLDPASRLAQQLQGALAEARQRAGLPPGPATAAAPAAAVANAGGAAVAATPTSPPNTADAAPATPFGATAAGAAATTAVQVHISLAPALAAQAAPDDTVFIFARAAPGAAGQGGPKAPLAIQRKQVKDLPLTTTLDDSMAMSPALRISGVQQVIVGARISKSGNPMPQPGDLQGLSAAVPVGTQGLQVQISQVLPAAGTGPAAPRTSP